MKKLIRVNSTAQYFLKLKHFKFWEYPD